MKCKKCLKKHKHDVQVRFVYKPNGEWIRRIKFKCKYCKHNNHRDFNMIFG